MTWIKFHGEIRKGKHRGIPRALRFVFLELAHEARPLRGVVELPAGMDLVDGVHDILGGDRREVARALDLYTKGPDSDAPSIVIEGAPGALVLRIPSWEAWNTVDSSAERTREYRKRKRETCTSDEDVTRHAPVTAVTACDTVTIARGEERRSEEIPPVVPPGGGPLDGPEEHPELIATQAKPTKTRAAALPDGWQPPRDMLAFALSEGLNPASYEREIAKFRDWARNEKPRKDWVSSLRNWIRRVKPWDKSWTPAGTPEPETHSRAVLSQRAHDREAAEMRARGVDLDAIGRGGGR